MLTTPGAVAETDRTMGRVRGAGSGRKNRVRRCSNLPRGRPMKDIVD